MGTRTVHVAREERLSDAVYALTRQQREGLDASRVRNILTDLMPAISREIATAETDEREATVADFDAYIARYNGTSELDVFARTVLDGARVAIREAQAQRAGRCGKPMAECGGSCRLPVGHAGECTCSGNAPDDCPA